MGVLPGQKKWPQYQGYRITKVAIRRVSSVVNISFLSFHSFLSFIHFFQTIGAAFGAKKVTVGNKCVTLGIWVNLFF